MLDENLPTYFLKPSSDKPKQQLTYLFSQWGNPFEPTYTIRHPDPDHADSKNRYAAGLYDAYNPDILFAEVLLTPEWTQISQDQEVIKRNGGIPPPPEPVIPTDFVIQLYNPDQQVSVHYRPPSWKKPPAWIFEMPQQSFRVPSSSALDRGQHDPLASDMTPKIRFKWRRDGKMSSDLGCYLSGVDVNLEGGRKKHKEPDITVAIFKALKEVTLYEPNLHRVDLEDMKGFEVVLLLSAVVIRDVYFGQLKETFNIGAGPRKPSVSNGIAAITTASNSKPVPSGRPGSPVRDPRVPPTDARTQWELDAEAALLRRQQAEEERQRKHREKQEQDQIRKMLEDEEKERQRMQAEVDRETERLKRMYGKEDESARPTIPARVLTPQPGGYGYTQPPPPSVQTPNFPPPDQRHSMNVYPPTQPPPQPYMHPNPSWAGFPTQHPGPMPSQGPYMSGAAASQSSFLHPQLPPQQQQIRPKQSIFGFRRHSAEEDSRLTKKRSAMF